MHWAATPTGPGMLQADDKAVGIARAAHAAPAPRSRVGDPDLVSDTDDAVQTGHVVVGGVALELIADVALQRQPAVVDLDIDLVRGYVDVPDHGLKRRAADLIVVATVGSTQADLELVVNLIDVVDLPRVLGSGPPLAETLDRPAQCDASVVGGYRNLKRVRNAWIMIQHGDHGILNGGVGEHGAPFVVVDWQHSGWCAGAVVDAARLAAIRTRSMGVPLPT